MSRLPSKTATHIVHRVTYFRVFCLFSVNFVLMRNWNIVRNILIISRLNKSVYFCTRGAESSILVLIQVIHGARCPGLNVPADVDCVTSAGGNSTQQGSGFQNNVEIAVVLVTYWEVPISEKAVYDCLIGRKSQKTRFWARTCTLLYLRVCNYMYRMR